MQDLFKKPKSDKQKLWDWLREKKWAKTSEICQWGVDNYSPDRATRNARQLASEGKIRRMDPDKQKHLFGPIKENVWEIVNHFNPGNIGVNNEQ